MSSVSDFLLCHVEEPVRNVIAYNLKVLLDEDVWSVVFEEKQSKVTIISTIGTD